MQNNNQNLPAKVTIKKEFFGFLRWWHGGSSIQITNVTGLANTPLKYQKELSTFKKKFGANYKKYAITIKKGLLFNSIQFSAFLNSYFQPTPVGSIGVGLPTNQDAPTSVGNPYRHVLSDYYTPSFLTKIAAIIFIESALFHYNQGQRTS